MGGLKFRGSIPPRKYVANSSDVAHTSDNYASNNSYAASSSNRYAADFFCAQPTARTTLLKFFSYAAHSSDNYTEDFL